MSGKRMPAHKRATIMWQVMAEEEQRDDTRMLEGYNEWLESEGVDNESREAMIQWMQRIIDDQLKARIDTKKAMEQTMSVVNSKSDSQ